MSLAGCKSCRNDHPYVPYAIVDDGGAAPAPSASAAMATVHDAGAFVEQPAERAPAGAREWTFAGVRVVAPAGQVFELGLGRDFDDDGLPDVAAIVRDASRSRSAGTLVFYKGAAHGVGAPVTPLATGPLPVDETCEPSRRLGAVGRHSVFVELGMKCPAPVPGPSRFVAVLAFSPRPRAHFFATLVDPPGAPTMSLDADGSDRDGDGIDDVAVRVALEGGGPPAEPMVRASVVLSWFDRSAGMSRDEAEPDASLRGLAAVAAQLASRAKDAAQVAPKISAIRALYSALCSEGGAPRLLGVSSDGPLSCGSSHALEEAGLAEVRALATMGAPLRAAAALVQAQLAPATKTPARTRDAEAWIIQASPVSLATSARRFAAVPMSERGGQPSWGALAFEPSGKLLVRTAVGVVRADPQTGDEAEAVDVAPWSLAVVSPEGDTRLAGAYDPCDGVAIRAILQPTGEGQPRDVALPIGQKFRTKCAGAKREAVPAIALAWGAGGLEVMVEGVPLLITGGARAALLQSPLAQPVSLGSPRSPSGNLVVVPTALGLIVEGAKPRTLRARELDGAYGELRDCTVSDDGHRVACVRSRQVWVGLWP